MQGAAVLTSYFLGLCIALVFAEDFSLSNHIDGDVISKLKKINPLDYSHPVGRRINNEGLSRPQYEELKAQAIEEINSVDFKHPIGKKTSQKWKVKTVPDKTEHRGNKAGLPDNASPEPIKLQNVGLDVPTPGSNKTGYKETRVPDNLSPEPIKSRNVGWDVPSTREVERTYDPPISDLIKRKLGVNVLSINNKPRMNKQSGRRLRKNRRRGLQGIRRKLRRRLRRKKFQTRAKNFRRKNRWRAGRKLKQKHGKLRRKHAELKRKHGQLRRKHRKLQQRLKNLNSKTNDPKIHNPIL